MHITCIGGGPAGLYFSILLKQIQPSHEISVYERNSSDDTFGWGIVFPDAMLDSLSTADSMTYARIQQHLRRWDECAVLYKGQRIVSGGHGFAGIGRHKLLAILQERARELGVHLHFNTEYNHETAPNQPAADLIVIADGAHSALRDQNAHYFQPTTRTGKCRYFWFGVALPLHTFTFISEPSAWGWFQAHAYPLDAHTSTLIVECREETWRAAGLDRMDAAQSARFCEQIFATHLQGQPLRFNPHHPRGHEWLRFNTLTCQHWFHKNRVLVGDAAHTLHFSVGSGTRLAMEDAIALSHEISQIKAHDPDELQQALQRYQDTRKIEIQRLQHAAHNRMDWFENVARYAHFEPEQFAYALLTSSQRLGHANLRLRDAKYIERMEAWFARQSTVTPATESSAYPRSPRFLYSPSFPHASPLSSSSSPSQPAPPPMFTPFRLGALTLKNRVVVSPMAMYSCTEGMVADFHLAHLGSRALGGAALVMTEMTAISRDARITPGCAGLWNDEQEHAWQRIVNFVHSHSDACMGLQLGHAGPKGSTQLGWQAMDEPLTEDHWPLLAASALPYGIQNQTPRAMTRQDMDITLAAFQQATERACRIGFDMLELHCAHGYLLSSFICPLTNQRTDEYGGSLENRLRFPLEICRALRALWPASRPLAVRISAHDWVDGGNTPDDAVVMAQRFHEAGADLIDVSSGQTTRAARPAYGRMYQTPFADRIRNETGIATMAVGNIFEADHVNTIIAAGRADLCAIGRPHLVDASWTLRAAARLGYHLPSCPPQYLGGQQQLEYQSRYFHHE